MLVEVDVSCEIFSIFAQHPAENCWEMPPRQHKQPPQMEVTHRAELIKVAVRLYACVRACVCGGVKCLDMGAGVTATLMEIFPVASRRPWLQRTLQFIAPTSPLVV